MDDAGLTGSSGAEPVAAGPLIERIVRSVIEQRIAGAARQALDDPDRPLFDGQQIQRLALEAAHQQLADLADPPGLYYLTLDEWTQEWLFPVYRRSVEGHSRMWCPEWWRHAEAVARLESLWRAWEHLRLDAATGLSVWFRDHADHHMAVLLDADGPFKRCHHGHANDPIGELPHEPAPQGMFQPEDPAPGPSVGARGDGPPARGGGGGHDQTPRRTR